MTNDTRTAIVTGGSRGIGRSTVQHLAQRGVHSIFTYNSGKDEATAVAAEAEAAGVRAIPLPLQAGDIGRLDGFVESVASALGDLGVEHVDYLVNNAGISSHTPFAELTEAELDSIYTINFKGVLLLTQKLLPLIADGGRIVNISSGVVRFVNQNSTPYAALKGAIEVFTRYLAVDLAPRGITVNTIAPGPIATDFSGGVVRDNPEVGRLIAGMTAMGRAGQPDDIGGMIASFLTGDNGWVTAQRIEVSGGTRL